MKKLILVTSLASLLTTACSPCYAIVDEKLPQQIVCDKDQYCLDSDPKYKVEGWTLRSTEGYIKPGVYKFSSSIIYGNPRDSFIKYTWFTYSMIDKDGYEYTVQYASTGWLLPVNPYNYHTIPETSSAECRSTNIEDCYLTSMTPSSNK